MNGQFNWSIKSMSDELITVSEFDTAIEAEIAKLELENNGINSVVVGDNTATMLPNINCIKVEIKVMDSDVEKAKGILGSHGEDSGKGV